MPCLIGRKVNMVRHNILFFLALKQFGLFSLIQSRSLNMLWIVFPFSHLPSICPVSISIPPFLVMCLKNINYIFLMVSITFLFISIFSKFPPCPVYGILCILSVEPYFCSTTVILLHFYRLGIVISSYMKRLSSIYCCI